MVLELGNDPSSGELRGRPFASWVYYCNSGGDELNEGLKALAKDSRRVQKKTGAKGFTANEWAADASRCVWWSEAELRAWGCFSWSSDPSTRATLEEYTRTLPMAVCRSVGGPLALSVAPPRRSAGRPLAHPAITPPRTHTDTEATAMALRAIYMRSEAFFTSTW